METLLNPRQTLHNPAELYLKWSGSAEKVKIGEDKYQTEGGYLYYTVKDDDTGEYERVKFDFPVAIYPLGESYSIRGGVYDAQNKSNNTTVSSSEFGGWDEPVTVYEKGAGDDRGVVIARGTWEEIKDTVKAHKGKVGTNLYGICVLNGEKKIVRFEANGGVGRELSEYRRKTGAAFYNSPLIFDKAIYKVNGAVTYAVPVFKSGDAYDESTSKTVQEYAAKIAEYGNSLRGRNMNNADKAVITDAMSDEDYEKVMSQETEVPGEAEASQENNGSVDLSEVPF